MCHLPCVSTSLFSCHVSMIKPLNTELNRTLLATKVIEGYTEEQVREFATFILASSYDKDATYFFSDWERYNGEEE